MTPTPYLLNDIKRGSVIQDARTNGVYLVEAKLSEYLLVIHCYNDARGRLRAKYQKLHISALREKGVNNTGTYTMSAVQLKPNEE
jgi:hypothetical protein